MEISRQTETEQPLHATCEPPNVCLSMCKLLDGSESMQTGLTSEYISCVCMFGWDANLRGTKLG